MTRNQRAIAIAPRNPAVAPSRTVSCCPVNMIVLLARDASLHLDKPAPPALLTESPSRPRQLAAPGARPTPREFAAGTQPMSATATPVIEPRTLGAVPPPTPGPAAAPPRERLLSLDVFRGMTVAGMLLVNNPGSWATIYSPLEHAKWHGWTPTDVIFPFFLFIVGITTHLSLGARQARGDDERAIVRQVLRR